MSPPLEADTKAALTRNKVSFEDTFGEEGIFISQGLVTSPALTSEADEKNRAGLPFTPIYTLAFWKGAVKSFASGGEENPVDISYETMVAEFDRHGLGNAFSYEKWSSIMTPRYEELGLIAAEPVNDVEFDDPGMPVLG